MKKSLIFFFLLVLQSEIWTQSNAPKFLLPIMKNSNEYNEVYYSEGKTYSCEEWMEQYTQLYHSNRTSDKPILKPSEKYAVIKDKAQKDNCAKFFFELYNTSIFKQNTNSTVVEQLLNPNQLESYFDPYIEDEQLVITGIMLPHTMQSGDHIDLSPENREVLFTYVDDISFFSSKTISSSGSSDGVKLGFINGTSFRTSIPRSELRFLKIKVLLKNGRSFTYNYGHEKCELDPDGIALEPDLSPPPAGPIPRIPELDPDCNIKPSYTNNPLNGEPYTAQFPFVDNSTGSSLTSNEIIGYVSDPSGTYYIPIYDVKQFFIPSEYSTIINPAVHGEYGQVKTTVFLNPYHAKLRKPFIVTDGIDFLSNRTWREILENLGGNDMISLLWDGGYDLVIVDFAGGADYIQRNSFALIEFIRALRHEQKIKEIAGIVGPSMGGQIVRHALLYWEQNLKSDPAYGEHNLDLFVSADSPWNGANASPAVQGFARHNKDKSPTMMQVDMSANAPAARQLLLNQIDAPNNTISQIYVPGEHPLKTDFDAELAAMGSVPQEVGKIISIADGAGNGTTTNVAPGGLILGIDYETCNSWYLSECQFTNEMNGVNSQSNLIFKNCDIVTGLGFSCNKACLEFPKILINSSTSRFYDSCPASPFRLTQYFAGFKEGMEIYNQNGFKMKIKDIRFGSNFAFIPAFSALGMPLASVNNDFTLSAVSSSLGYALSGSPFDYVYFDNTDSGHNSFSSMEQAGSLPFLLSHLSYQKIYSTRCIIDQTIASPTQIFYVEQGASGSLESFCIPFKYDDYHIAGDNPCGLSLLTNEGSNAYYLQSDLVDTACDTEAEICFETECGTECITISVVTYPGATNPFTGVNAFYESHISIYPNPSAGGLFSTSIDLANYDIAVYNTLGQQVSHTLASNTIALTNSVPGVHFLEIKSKATRSTLYTKKIVIE